MLEYKGVCCGQSTALLPHSACYPHSTDHPLRTKSKNVSCVKTSSLLPLPITLSFSFFPRNGSSLTPAFAESDVVAASAFFAAMRIALNSLMTAVSDANAFKARSTHLLAEQSSSSPSQIPALPTPPPVPPHA